ncbi:chemotaxis protein CheB [Methylocystis heyeri]|uniref:Response regulator n=1 Tax=Methylocystis heyeri TaxID=391905 RepID=A0A6B8KGB7_9HYPH|nr:chemotaxis protein CheB [Methylocystis heyeri]QGM46041.1 response regulator [Methylocystis heyeri]
MTSPAAARSKRVGRKSAGALAAGKSAESGAFPVVAVGASAGGLEAFRSFLDAQTPKSGMALVMIQHLDPTHPSLMVELLSSHTSMAVVQATDGAPLEPDHVYLIPPGVSLAIRAGLLRLSKPTERHGARLPFDFFLGSLAEALGELAICVVLSGSGGDGSVGLLAIKEKGGLVIVQDPEEAEFDGMPRSAIATGAVDFVASVADIPDLIFRQLHPASSCGVNAPKCLTDATSDEFAQIIALLRDKTSHDFSVYKKGTLERRLEHRMSAVRIEDRPSYLKFLCQKPGEIELLRKDLLIGVTQMFRVGPAFEFLSKEIVPDLVNQQKDQRSIRVWCPGCSTGEEPYSIAMLFLEAFEELKRPARLQIFASDINGDAVAFAREGLYPSTIEADVTPDRLTRFFSREDHHYRVANELRDCVVFTVHDILADAPFSNIDLVCCRNLLIYLQPEAQHKILSFFHFALRDGGVLFLGGSEVVGSDEHFEAVSKKYRIYRHLGRSRPGEVAFPTRTSSRMLVSAMAKPQPEPPSDFDHLTRSALIETFALGSVVIDARHECVHFSGAIEKYLGIALGAASNDVLAMARDGLRPKLRAAIERASREHTRVVVKGAHLEKDGDETAVCVIVQPLMTGEEQRYLISFLDDSLAESRAVRSTTQPTDQSRVAELERELEVITTDLENAIHDLDNAKEEQKRISQQAMSLNEEAQSTNEELVTSKEELQSVNEELTALNSQLHETLERQRNTSNDLQNILESSGIATIFLDEQLKIRFFTPAAMSLFSVIATDIGRPLADFTSLANDSNLICDASIVLDEQKVIEREISTQHGVWYNRLILPYRTHDGLVEGVVITFTNITEKKRTAEALAAAKQAADQANVAKSRFLAAASHDLRQPLQTIRLLQGLLAEKSKGVETQTLLKRLDAMVGVMSGMLNTLLDINQLEAGVIHTDIENFALNELFEHLNTDFSYHMQAQGLDWRVVSSKCVVRSDPRLLEQILRNLLSNALKFTTSGKVLLGCRRRGDTMRIEVWDTGPGIAEEDRLTIFEEFHQINNPARERSKGLGLGLAIVQRLSSLLSHPIDLKSLPGCGSMFSICVPIAARANTPLNFTRRGSTSEHAKGSASILVIEDDPSIRELLDMLLRGAGHRPIAAADGVAALASTEQPDIVVADFKLPNGPSGVEVVVKLREKFQREIPAIVLTGDISTQTLRAIANLGCTHLDKPVETAELLRAIAHFLPAPTPIATPDTETKPSNGHSSATIFVVDDDAGVRDAVREMLEAHGWSVATFSSCEAFLQTRRPEKEGCLVIDAVLPGMNGFELLARLKADKLTLPSIMITANGDVSTAVKAMRAGASDFIEKPFGHEELIASIAHALEQNAQSGPSYERRTAAAAQLDGLTKRQREILKLVLAGHPSKNIAADLGVSQRTIENHRAAIMRKTKSRSIPALIRLAIAAD